MAIPIASIPVLTGEVENRFEDEAQANYQGRLNRTEKEKKLKLKLLKEDLQNLDVFWIKHTSVTNEFVRG